jgi:hypothetical protein
MGVLTFYWSDPVACHAGYGNVGCEWVIRQIGVAHPRDWPWAGYQEIMGHRHRYRVLDFGTVVLAVASREY